MAFMCPCRAPFLSRLARSAPHWCQTSADAMFWLDRAADADSSKPSSAFSSGFPRPGFLQGCLTSTCKGRKAGGVKWPGGGAVWGCQLGLRPRSNDASPTVCHIPATSSPSVRIARTWGLMSPLSLSLPDIRHLPGPMGSLVTYGYILL